MSNLKSKQVLTSIILLALSFGIYLNTYQNQFVFDDKEIVDNDHRIRSVRHITALFTEGYWLSEDTGAYRPITMFAFAVNYLMSGVNSWSYHLLNQVFHSLNVFLLFIFLGNFFKEKFGIRFLSAAIFAVHPAASEAVNLIAGRAELLSFAFSLSAFHLYINREKGKLYRFGSLVCFFLGMMSKETAMVLPVLLLLHQLYFEHGKIATLVRNISGFGVILLLYIGIRYAVLGGFGPQNEQQFFYGVPFVSTVFTMTKALAWYWKIAFCPAGIHMSYDFNDIPVAYSLLDAGVSFSLTFLIFVAVTAWHLYSTNKTVSYFILWIFISFSPVMNVIVPTGILMAPRVMYTPLAGYSVIIAALIYGFKPYIVRERSINSGWSHKAVFPLIIICVLIVLAVKTIDRNADWKNSETLFRKELQLSPKNIVAIKGLASVLPPEDAEQMIKKSISKVQDNPEALSIFAALMEKKGNFAIAENLYRLSLNLRQKPEVYTSLGILLSNSGRIDEAEELFRTAIRIKPFWAGAYENLGIVLYKKGRLAEAFEMGQKALQLNPDAAIAYNLLGSLYKENGNIEQAVWSFQKAAALSPRLYAALYNLADTYEKTDAGKALSAWEDYVRVAQGVKAEAEWIEYARKRIAALSQSSR